MTFSSKITPCCRLREENTVFVMVQLVKTQWRCGCVAAVNTDPPASNAVWDLTKFWGKSKRHWNIDCFKKGAKFYFAGIIAQRDEGRRRILLGDDTGTKFWCKSKRYWNIDYFKKGAKFYFAGMIAQRDEVSWRILLGDDRYEILW